MKVVYVAGPYSAPNAWEREQNIRRAEELSLRLVEFYVAPICVHTMARYWFDRVSEGHVIECDMALLRRCDAVLLVEGWENSQGTLDEIREAFRRGIPVYDSLAAFREGRRLERWP